MEVRLTYSEVLVDALGDKGLLKKILLHGLNQIHVAFADLVEFAIL